MSTVTAAGAPPRRHLHDDLSVTISRNEPIYRQSPVRHVKFFVAKGHGHEFVFEEPMTAGQVRETLFGAGRHAPGDVQLAPAGREPATTWQVRVMGVDAAAAWKTPVFRAAGDAVVYGQPALPPGLPAAVRAHLECHTVPVDAKRHPGNVHVWEQEGCLVHVTQGHGSYVHEVATLSSCAVSNHTIRWFMLEQGLPRREAWQAFVKHWDEIHRQVVAAYAMAQAAMADDGRTAGIAHGRR